MQEPAHNPILQIIETRPSALTGIAWYFVLAYNSNGQEHNFEELLPQDWASWDEESRNIHLVGVAGRLKEKLRPIILREDKEHLSLVEPGTSEEL